MSAVDPNKNRETEQVSDVAAGKSRETEQVSDVAAGKSRETEPESNEPIKLYDEDEYNEEEDGDFVSIR